MINRFLIIGTALLLFFVSTGCIESSNENNPPEVMIYANPINGTAPLRVQFNCTVNDTDGHIISYYWKFGDGSSSTVSNPVHTFKEEGNYKVQIIVSDDDRVKDVDYLEIIVLPSSVGEEEIVDNDVDLKFVKGEIERHEANLTTGFPWFSYVPESLKKSDDAYILIEASYLGDCDPSNVEENVKINMNRFTYYAESWKYVLLTPAFNARCVHPDIDEWVRHFPRYIFTLSPSSVYYRIDNKLTAMIDELIVLLNDSGYNVKQKVFLMGFSIGGQVANKYSLLHPERVVAFSAGGIGGQLTLPERYYNGYAVKWGWGVYDYESLVGECFKKDQYLGLPHYVYSGDQDLYDSHLTGTKWKSIFGGDTVTAVRNQCLFEKEYGYNVTYKEYQGVGHEYTYDIIQDSFDFFKEVRYEDN
jgi:PKD repeat protein